MIVRSALQFLQLAILARVLAPSEFGLMAMVGVVLSFATLVSDLGLSSAFVQRQDVSIQQRSSLFWINVATSSLLSAGLLTASPLLAIAFNDERLTPLFMLISPVFVLTALGQQIRVNAEKSLNFRPIVLTEIVSAISGFAITIGLALAGWGVHALVWGSIVSAAGSSLLAWRYLSDGWRPQWRCRISDVRQYLSFGGAVLSGNIVNQINATIDLMLGGRLLGAAQLGLYSIPRNLILQIQLLVNPIITRVGFPLIAQVQHDVERLRSVYLKTLNMTASTNAPLYLGIAFFSPEIVSLLLGAKWGSSTELLRILAAWGFFRSLANPVGSLLLGAGRAGMALKWNLILMLLVPPVLWWSANNGPVGLACALLGISAFMFIPAWRILVWPVCQISIADYAVVTLRPAMLAAAAVFPAYLLTRLFELDLVRFTLGVSVAGLTYILLSYAFNREWTTAMCQLLRKT